MTSTRRCVTDAVVGDVIIVGALPRELTAIDVSANMGAPPPDCKRALRTGAAVHWFGPWVPRTCARSE